jgi:hypothetical protein
MLIFKKLYNLIFFGKRTLSKASAKENQAYNIFSYDPTKRNIPLCPSRPGL